MSKTVHDLANDAYTAARARDIAAIDAAVAEIVAAGRTVTMVSMRLWIDRALIPIKAGTDDELHFHLKIMMEPENLGTDDPGQHLCHVPAGEISWTGNLFFAHCTRNNHTWDSMWDHVPDDQVHAYVRRLLTTMALTAMSYEDELAGDPEPACCGWHGWFTNDLALTDARIAVAHLN